MRGRDERGDGLFSYVDLETRVPVDHPLRAIRVLVDEALAALSPDFETYRRPLHSLPDGEKIQCDSESTANTVFDQLIQPNNHLQKPTVKAPLVRDAVYAGVLNCKSSRNRVNFRFRSVFFIGPSVNLQSWVVLAAVQMVDECKDDVGF